MYLITCIIFLNTLVYLAYSQKRSDNIHSENALRSSELFNWFTRCTIHAINFPGLDINFEKITEPIVLLHYFSFPKTQFIYPIEYKTKTNFSKPYNPTLSKNIDVMDKSNSLENIGKNYLNQLFSNKFRLDSKNLNCEATIYLIPPTKNASPELYIDKGYWKNIFKNPIETYRSLNKDIENWKINYLNTIPLYSVLVCDLTIDPVCSKYPGYRRNWIKTVLGHVTFVRLSESILIWELSPKFGTLKVFCPFCDLCDPHSVVTLATISHRSTNIEVKATVQEFIRNSPGPFKTHVALISDSDVKYDLEDKRTRLDTIKIIQSVDLNEEIEAFETFSHIHILSLTFEKFSNMTFSTVDRQWTYWRKISFNFCPVKKYVNVHPKLTPKLLRRPRNFSALHQEISLIFFKQQLRFVSCHKEQKHWVGQLKELVTVFDTSTWLLFLMTCLTVSYFLKVMDPFWERKNKKLKFYWGVYFPLVISVVDQPCNFFEKRSIRQKLPLYIILFALPMSWFCLSTLYKGDNITNLTADPPMTPFETFDSLITNGFVVYSRRVNLSSWGYMDFFNVEQLTSFANILGKVDGHEKFPIVSEFWLRLINQFGKIKNHNLAFFKNEISNETWKQLNHSTMMPNQNLEFSEEVPEILDFYMDKCNKSAIILAKAMALQLFTLLKAQNNQAYFGKDIITEILWGYGYYGYFPTKILDRGRYLFQTGIASWWKKYLEFVLVVKTNANQMHFLYSNQTKQSVRDENSNTALVVLSLLPAFGLSLSIMAFVLIDTEFLKVLYELLLKLLLLPKNIYQILQYILWFLFKRSNVQLII